MENTAFSSQNFCERKDKQFFEGKKLISCKYSRIINYSVFYKPDRIFFPFHSQIVKLVFPQDLLVFQGLFSIQILLD